jgi:acyl-CoA synthetase (AMP-forming)/AMP-acid ligase II
MGELRDLPELLISGLETAFTRDIEDPLDDVSFDALARSAFAWQYEHNRHYRAFCDRRARTPSTITHWSLIPAVPTAAFREVELTCAATGLPDAVFRTSGTTGGERRGVHVVPDISFYHRSLIPNFAAMLLPEGEPMTMISLVPPPRDLPDSSLSHMIATVMQRFGTRDSRWCASAQAGIDHDGLGQALAEARGGGAVVCLLGTSFAFVHWTDAMRDRDERHRLPDGSRLMDTGGFKGRSREVGRAELRATYLERLGIPRTHCVNEYGMTELCSQFYDGSLRDAVLRHRLGADRKVPPPWVRTVVVDPDTLEPVPDGREGLLRHTDLANIGSVIAVQTEDTGIVVDGGFRVLGRAAGARPRGCSIAMDDLLEAVNRGTVE